MSWFYAEDGAQKGPVSEDRFQQLVQAGSVRADTLVWREGMPDWQAYGQVAAAANAAPPAPPIPVDSGACVECAGVFPRKEMVVYGNALVCANCRDVFFQKVREGIAPTTVTGAAFEYGGFWIRFVAKFIDGLLLGVVNFILQMIFMAMFGAARELPRPGEFPTAYLLANLVLVLIQQAIWLGFSTFFIGKYGATPGKMALSLKIVRPDGARLTYARALGRAAAEYLDFGIGYVIAAFDDEKRALHDHICDTRVIKT